MTTNHSFRSRYATEAFGDSKDLWDTVLFESDNFVALPSVGALLEGWLLVVPRSSAICIGALSRCRQQELITFVRTIVPVMEPEFGPVAVFEHGPAQPSSAVGCGVDYAHLHLVPTKCDLLSGALTLAPEIRWERVSDISDTTMRFVQGIPYIFVQQPFDTGAAFIGTAAHIQSQLFRRVIAQHVGRPFHYDWKQDPGLSMIGSTVSILKGHVDDLVLEPVSK